MLVMSELWKHIKHNRDKVGRSLKTGGGQLYYGTYNRTGQTVYLNGLSMASDAASAVIDCNSKEIEIVYQRWSIHLNNLSSNYSMPYNMLVGALHNKVPSNNYASDFYSAHISPVLPIGSTVVPKSIVTGKQIGRAHV